LKVLYITFIDFRESKSGSSVRPQRMYHAFKKLGYEVMLVSGNDMYHSGNEERKASIEDAFRWLQTNHPDYCYVENGTSPVKLSANWKLLSYIHKREIPIGYFYRDFYHKFPVSIGHGWIKDCFYRILYARDERNIRRNADIMYLPSKQCFSFFKHKKKRALPPGIELPKSLHYDENYDTCVYVGGVSESYGTFMLIEAFRIVNQEYNTEKMIHLKLVCRRSDVELFDKEYVESLYKMKWLELIHAEGNDLKAIFKKADVGLIPILKGFYSRQAIPIKISDYISNGLPIISTPLEAEIDFFGESKACLFSADDTAEEFAKTIREFYSNKETRAACQKSIFEFAEQNTWEKRVRQLEAELIE
jgi:glycosyltransferase involved in cell wall biosynthesis